MALAVTARTIPPERCVKYHLHLMASATNTSTTSILILMEVIAVITLAEAPVRTFVARQVEDTLIMAILGVRVQVINGS